MGGVLLVPLQAAGVLWEWGMSRVLARLLVIVEQLMNSCLAVFRWISVTKPGPELEPDEIALIRHCAAVIRGDVPGAEARPDAPPGSFPKYGRHG